MEGAKLRMGEVWFQNEALTSAQVLGLSDMLDSAWKHSNQAGHKERLEELMCYVLIGFGAGLRGEEIPLISLKGLLFFWDETKSEADPYTMITLHGRFKGETGFRWHCLPVSDQTRSDTPLRMWIGRLLYRRVHIQGRSTGWLLQRDEQQRVKIINYDPDFHSYMEELNNVSLELFSVGTVMGLYSLRRPMRRGA